MLDPLIPHERDKNLRNFENSFVNEKIMEIFSLVMTKWCILNIRKYYGYSKFYIKKKLIKELYFNYLYW